MAHLTLSPEVRAVLESCTFRGLTVKMPPLSAKLYREVNKVLANAGGVWNRGQQAHVFTHDPREKLGLVLETGKSIDTQKLFQAFYTPTGLARRVVEMARVAGKRVLEPSGGVGALANRIAEQARELVVVELDPEAIGVLQQTGHYVVPGDFLEKTAEDLGGEFDAVVMNPPFSGDQDIRHVRHAFSMLKAGGDLVAIMSPGFTFGETRIRREFRQWQAELEADTYELAEGTFAESGTNIRTIILCLSKPMTHENSADEVQSEPAARAQGQRLDGVDLQTVLDSAANADELGRQQFFTPRDIATALCVPLPAARRTFVDLMMGDGALIAGAMAGNKHPSATGIGVDIDRRCARQPADLDVPVVTCSADLTRLYPLLEDLNWQYDLGGFNPPFSMKWYTDRLRTLAESEVTAVRTTFKAGKEHIDSTLASMLIALDRMTPGGEAFFICNHSTAVRLLGDPDLATAGEGCGQNDRHQQELANAPAAALRRHVWLWLTLPAGVFSNVRDFETAVLYFARAHDGDTPLHLTAPSAAASDIATTLATARSLRGVMRRGRHIYSMDQCSPTTVSLFRAAKDEYLRLVRTTDKPQWNLWLQDGTIRRYLTPFQTFSGKIPKPLIAKLNDLHGKTPMSLVVQKPSRMALLEALRTEFWRVQPELIEAVEVACRAYAAERAPYYPMNETQRIGFLDEEDTIICRKAFAGFTPGEAFVLESTTRKIERNFTRPNILGTEENVTLHGTELVIRVRHPQGLWWEFATFNDEELARPSKDGSRKARLELLPEHFIIPEVADVAMLHPEQYQANLAALAKLEERLAGKAGPRPPERGPAPTPINPSATHSLAIPTSEGNSSLAAPVQPTKKSTFAFRQYQRDDIARFCIHDGGVFAWDKGLGKTVALYSIMHVKGARRVLIVAPESLHEQIVQEGRDKFGVTVKALRSQADFYADAALQQVTMDVRNGRSSEVAGYWITSYTALGYNGGDEWGGKEDDNGEKIVSAKMKATRKLDPLWRSEADEKGIGDVHGTTGIRCLYQPSLSTLVADLFDGVACDEAVRIKSNESYVSLGVRQMRAKVRVVLTGTPIKNHLIDIFWLIHWSCGGHAEPCARFPYGNSNAEKEAFGNTHCFIEENHTREEKAALVGRRRKFERRVAQICNVHRLWKLLAPSVLCRRKQDIGEAIVPKTIVPVLVKPGTAQNAVYKFHVENPPDFTRAGSAMNPVAQIVSQLTNLRQAALCPHSSNLSSAHIRLHKVREILQREAGVPQLEAMDAEGFPLRPFDRAATQKAVLVARKGESCKSLGPNYAAEAQVALEIVERMIAGSRPIDLEAIFAAAPSLTEKLRPAVVTESNAKSSRSWTDHNPKQAAILKLIEELIGKGEQVVVMSPFGAFSQSLHDRLVEAGVSVCLLDGGTSPAKRGVMAGQFKRGKYAVLIGGQKSMGEGHSFECAAHLIMPSLDWALDTNSQCEDRVHRLNSTKPVTIYAMATENTIDTRLANLYAEKGDSASLALFAELSDSNKGEINLGQLLADAIKNFDPHADTIDEADIESEWEGSLKGRLRAAEARFRQWHPPIVPDAQGQRVTPAEVRQATAAAGLHPTVQIVKGIRDATFGVLLGGITSPAAIAAGRAEFEAFCAAGNYTDWRIAWRAFDAQPRKANVAAPKPLPLRDARQRANATLDQL